VSGPQTPLDAAHAAQAAAPEDGGARLRFHERVLDAELVVPLVAEAAEGAIDLRVYDLSDGRFVLAFDRDERLAAFLDEPVRFAALSGRRLAALLEGRGIGIALNLGVPSATLLPPASVDWLARMAGAPPEQTLKRIDAVAPPGPVPSALLVGLGTKLAAMADVIEAAFLARAAHAGGETRLLLFLAGVPEPARPAVSAAVAEAVRFATGAEEVDVLFADVASPHFAAAVRHGARLALPRPADRRPPAPGTDPDRPPRLRQ
jgi:SseB protein N-terminal domain